MKCKQCGFELKENIKYCTNCGLNNNENQNKQKSFYGKNIIIGLVLLNLIATMSIVIYYESKIKNLNLEISNIYNINKQNTTYDHTDKESVYIEEKDYDVYNEEINSNIKDNNIIEEKVWEGTYEAGEYDRSVKITFLEDETITFEFGPTEKTTHVPYGKYLMKVNSYDESSGELKLEGYDWVEKPDIDWDFAKFNGFIDANEFKGEVYNKSKNHYLGTFKLYRVY